MNIAIPIHGEHMVKVKNNYKGLFAYRNELKTEYVYAFSEKQAKVIMCRRIAKKQGVIPSVVMNYFNGEKDNYSIKIEVEYKEA
jgi:hypothetical protein